MQSTPPDVEQLAAQMTLLSTDPPPPPDPFAVTPAHRVMAEVGDATTHAMLKQLERNGCSPEYIASFSIATRAISTFIYNMTIADDMLRRGVVTQAQYDARRDQLTVPYEAAMTGFGALSSIAWSGPKLLQR